MISFRFPHRQTAAPTLARWLLALALTAVSAAAHAVPASERAFLLDFYADMHPEYWFDSSNWGGPVGTECTWYGVICDGAGDHVLGLEMVRNNVWGTLPASLSEQTQLKIFRLPLNFFEGPIPPLGALVNLVVFEATQQVNTAAGYGLTGSLPSLAGLRNLRRFNVNHNRLEGTIPPFPTENGPVALEEYVVAANQLSGAVPAFDGMPRLATIDVSANAFSGALPSLAHLTDLTFFGANGNQFGGPLPPIAGLQRLVQFYARNNQFDRIPSSLADLPVLEVYDVASNRLEGQIPALDQVPNLRVFYVNDNALVGALPTFDATPDMVHFDASNNRLSGRLPEIAGLASMGTFHAANNQLSGGIPSLADLPMMNSFDVSHNRLGGTIPVLNGMPRLGWFKVNDNHLSGTAPRVAILHMLLGYDVSNNRLTGPAPPIVPGGIRPDGTALCPNHLDPEPSVQWDQATGETPWYQACTAFPDVIWGGGFEPAP